MEREPERELEREREPERELELEREPERELELERELERELELELEREREREPERELELEREREREREPMSKRPITFKQWAKRYGIAKLAKEIGVCRTTPYKWLLPKSHPRYKRIGYYTAVLIQALASRHCKEFTIEEIMGGGK